MPKPILIKDDEHFDQLHRSCGGSSFSPALFDHGFEDMPSAYSVFAHFAGAVEHVGPDESRNIRVRIGKMMEAVIAAEVAFQKGWDVIEGPAYWSAAGIDHKEPGGRVFVMHDDEALNIGCTVDRYVKEHEDGPGLVECKNRDYLTWVNTYLDGEASIRDRIQLAHQFLCHPEIKWGCVAALVGGNTLETYIYKREDLADIMADLDMAWRDMWRRVRENDEPTLTGRELPLWLTAHLNNLGKSPDVLEIGQDVMCDDLPFDVAARTYLDASSLAKTYDKTAADMKARIVQALQEHGRARSNLYAIQATYTHMNGSAVALPPEIRDGLRTALQFNGLRPGDRAAIEQAIAWSQETRRPSVQTRLKFDYIPINEQAAPADKKPSAEALKVAADAQAPLDRGAKQ